MGLRRWLQRLRGRIVPSAEDLAKKDYPGKHQQHPAGPGTSEQVRYGVEKASELSGRYMNNP